MHIGSQILDAGPYREGVARLLERVGACRAAGIATITLLDIGGGLGNPISGRGAPRAGGPLEAVLPAVRASGLALAVESNTYVTRLDITEKSKL